MNQLWSYIVALDKTNKEGNQMNRRLRLPGLLAGIFLFFILTIHADAELLYPTTTALTSSANPAVYGQAITFTANVTVTGTNNPVTGGSVTFKNNGEFILGCTSLPVSAGAVSCGLPGLPVSSYTITAEYSGTADYYQPSMGALTQVVNKASTTTTVESSTNPAVFGESVTFTATVSVISPGSGNPTGTVTFKDGSTTLGTGALSSPTATFSTSFLSVGSHSITAVYGGDTNFTGSTSPPLFQTIISTAVPTMTEWGMIIFIILAGLGAVYYLRRQRNA